MKTNEKDLQNMYRELLNMRGFSEDCIKSILHRLVCTLIKYTKSCDFEVCINSIIVYFLNLKKQRKKDTGVMCKGDSV